MGENNNRLVGDFLRRCQQDYVSDAGHSIIKCSKCGTELVEIWHTKPYVQITTAVTVVCGLCGDKSFTKNISGGFHVGVVEGGKVRLVSTTPGTVTQDGNMIKTELSIVTEKG